MSETISVRNMFSPGLGLEFSCIELVIQMHNLLLYCGLVDAKISAPDKDLPVHIHIKKLFRVTTPLHLKSGIIWPLEGMMVDFLCISSNIYEWLTKNSFLNTQLDQIGLSLLLY